MTLSLALDPRPGRCSLKSGCVFFGLVEGSGGGVGGGGDLGLIRREPFVISMTEQQQTK